MRKWIRHLFVRLIMPPLLAAIVIYYLYRYIGYPDKAFERCLNLFVGMWRKVSKSYSAIFAEKHLPDILQKLEAKQLEELIEPLIWD